MTGGSLNRDRQRPGAAGRSAVFLDRDGVVNKVIVRDSKPFSPDTLDEFVLNDGLEDFVEKVRSNGYKVVVITNQPDLARGRITPELLDQMTRRIREHVVLDDVFICPHDDSDRCACRKPKPGMLIEASRKLKINLETSYFIGDTWKDVEAGRAAGCRTILLDAAYNKNVDSDFRVASLSEAASVILTSHETAHPEL